MSELPNYTWIKFPISSLEDPDFMQLSEGAAGIYTKLYLMAGRSDAEGAITNHKRMMTHKDISFLLRIPPERLITYLSELSTAGLLAKEEDGFKVIRFMEEQGPGKVTEREQWRERQQKHRQKIKNVDVKIKEEELEKEKEGEGEENRIESHGDVTESHRDITVTEKPPSHSLSNPLIQKPSFFEEMAQRLKEELEIVKGTLDVKRLEECISFWQELASREGWNPENGEAVYGLYIPGGLEERKKRENWRESKIREFREAVKEALGSNVDPQRFEEVFNNWKESGPGPREELWNIDSISIECFCKSYEHWEEW